MRYFVAVAELLSFRRAADRLAITQPPLTRQIQALESALGTQLLVRDKRGVALTASGADVLRESRDLLARTELLTTRYRQPAAEGVGSAAHRDLRLGLTTVVDSALFTWLEPALKVSAPGLRMVFRRQISQRSIQDLLRGRLDAAVIGLPSQTFDLALEPLTNEPLMLALPGGHPLARRQRVALPELGPGPLFWFQRSLNTAYYDHFEAVFKRLGFAPDRLPEPQDHHVLLGLIASGQGAALVPRSLTVIGRPGVVYKRLHDEGLFQIGLALTYRHHAKHAALDELRRALQEHFRLQ